LTQEVSLPGRFAVLVPNSSTIGISKRLPDGERRRLRKILDEGETRASRPHRAHGRRGCCRRRSRPRRAQPASEKWAAIESEASRSPQPRLVYRDLDLAVRVLREELNDEYRGVIIDDRELYEKVRE
jgi:ribonuclease E